MNKKYLILIIVVFIILIPIVFYIVKNNHTYQIAPLKDYNNINKKIIVSEGTWNT